MSSRYYLRISYAYYSIKSFYIQNFPEELETFHIN